MGRSFTERAGDGRTVLVRVARAGDARACIALAAEAARERPRTILTQPYEVWSPARWRRARAGWTPEGVLLVAELEGGVVGSISCNREQRPAMSHAATLGIIVARRARGIGVGRALMVGVERWATEQGIDRLTLTVFPHNEPALRLYRALGYREEGLARHAVRFPDEDLDLVMMAKLLRARPEDYDGPPERPEESDG